MRYTPINITTVGSLRALLKKLDKYGDDQIDLIYGLIKSLKEALEKGESK